MSMPGEIHHCRSCGKPIIWMDTASGKNMPIDADTYTPGDAVFDAKKHRSHFATCPKADMHRKRR